MPAKPGHMFRRSWAEMFGIEVHYDSYTNSSEAHLADPAGPVDDLAHMVAVQLLGACFTMPPDQTIGIPPSNYVASDCPTSNSTIIPDPRMTSSLRMHTHFRYSPCFGHQARNSSPIQLWTYDGHSPNTSPRLAPDIKPRFKGSNVLHEMAQLPLPIIPPQTGRSLRRPGGCLETSMLSLEDSARESSLDSTPDD
jgi:hypothetical protein